LKTVEIEIGGTKVDRHYGTWLDLWYELSHNVNQERGYRTMIGDIPELTALSAPNEDLVVKRAHTLYIPLQFWFCRNNGLALPLIALQYHEVRLHFSFEDADKLVVKTTDFAEESNSLRMSDASILVDYIFLDSEERRRFAQVGHEYLIEQVQFTGEESAQQKTIKTKLGFNHPCKELVWAIRNGNYLGSRAHSFLAYTHEDDWKPALNSAAENLLKNYIFFADQEDELRENDVRIELVDLKPQFVSYDLYSNTNLSMQESSVKDIVTHTIVHADDSEIKGVFYLDIVNVQTGEKVSYDTDKGIDKSNTVYNLYAKRSEPFFVINGVDLISKIKSFTAHISARVDPVNDESFLDVVNIHFSDIVHELTLDDISVPVSENEADNRVYTAGSNPLDVKVFQYHNYGLLLDGSGNPVDRALLQLNGHDRFDTREGAYFNYVQPHQHHSRTPTDGVNVYSFALNPEQHQPSGTANLSRIDNTQLNITFVDRPDLKYLNSDTKLYIFAVNYNVLRIMSGMGGLSYNN
jgi:hypothetical protein